MLQLCLTHARQLSRRPFVLLDGVGQLALPAAAGGNLGLGIAQATFGFFKRDFLVGGAAPASLVVAPAPLRQGCFRPADLLLPARHLRLPVAELSVQSIEGPLDLRRGTAEGPLSR